MFLKIIYIISSGLCAGYIAGRQRKNRAVWFFIGCFIGWIFPFAICIFPLLQKKPKAKPKTPSEPLPTIYPETTLWYYLSEDKATVGPVSFTLLKQKKKEGSIHNLTYLWNESFSEWKPLKEVFPGTE